MFTDMGLPMSEPTPSSVPSVSSVRKEMMHLGQLDSSGMTLGTGDYAVSCAAVANRAAVE